MSRAEAERQLVEAADRHREVVASMQEAGRPPAGQHVAVKAVARAVHMVSYSLKRAAATGVPIERMGELAGWDADLVREALERAPEPAFVERLVPPGLDAGAVAQAAAAIEATTRLEALTRRILDELRDDAWSPAADDVDDLVARLETTWQSWRDAPGRPPPGAGR